MTRQHATPILIPSDGSPHQKLTPLSLSGVGDTISELDIQKLIHAHPECLPIE